MDTSTARTDVVCLVVTGGDPIAASALQGLPPRSCTIGVDSGVGHALALGLHVDLAVGDFDSLDPHLLAEAEQSGTTVERHPAAKDATDLELGLEAAIRHGARRVVVLGGHGGRLDHLLANALLLAAPPFAGVVVEARMGDARVSIARPGAPATVAAPVGATVSLLPVGGIASGVSTTGLAYPLDAEDLRPGTTRGVSNVVTDPDATVSLVTGTLLVVLPGEPT